MAHKNKTAIIVGTEENAELLRKKLEQDPKIEILRIFTNDAEKASDSILRNWPDAVYCALNPDDDRSADIWHACELSFCTYYAVSKVDKNSDTLVIARWCQEPLKKGASAFFKRTFDIVVSGVFLVTFFPIIYIICAICIKISSPGPVLFKQARPGYHAEPFYCLKFRSMRANSRSENKAATQNDDRVTKFGRFIRKTSIDEIPQFINVFRGDMSLVGPRPQLMNQSDYYSPYISNFFMRSMVKPGITGWAQVSGFRGEMKSIEEMKGRVDKDVWYIENWTFWLDIKILFMTVAQIFKGDKQAY